MPTAVKRLKTRRIANYMEELTREVLEGLLPEYGSKRFDPAALRDIQALALNRLWPMYMTTAGGKAFLKKAVEQDRIEEDVIRHLRAAIDIVQSNLR